MRPTDHEEIRALPLFRGMDDANFSSLMRGGYVQTFPPQVELITEGDPSDFFHVVIEGSVELFAGWNGRETTMSIVRPIATFILAASLRDAPYLMSARTLEKARIVLIPSHDLRDVFDRDRDFAREVVVELSHCYRSMVKSAKDMKLRSSVNRLANYLLNLHETAGGASSFTLPVEKRKLASLLGMTPENLSRAIKALQPHGVEIEGAEVEISKPAALARVARPTPLIDDPSY